MKTSISHIIFGIIGMLMIMQISSCQKTSSSKSEVYSLTIDERENIIVNGSHTLSYTISEQDQLRKVINYLKQNPNKKISEILEYHLVLQRLEMERQINKLPKEVQEANELPLKIWRENMLEIENLIAKQNHP